MRKLMYPKKRVFCDLEQTLITSWGDFGYLSRTKKILEQHGVTDGFPVEIYSFAVDNMLDHLYFTRNYQEDIERIFNISITNVVLVNELITINEKLNDRRLSLFDFKKRGKLVSFLEYVCYLDVVEPSEEKISYLLFDDLVDDTDFEMDNSAVHFIHV